MRVRRYRNLSGEENSTPNMASMPASQYIMGLIGVGVLFFVIGYGWQRGKESA